MEYLKPKLLAQNTLHFIGSRLTLSAWAELGEKYGEAVGGLKPHQPTISAPEKPTPFPQGPHGSNVHIRLREPVENGWEIIEPREAA